MYTGDDRGQPRIRGLEVEVMGDTAGVIPVIPRGETAVDGDCCSRVVIIDSAVDIFVVAQLGRLVACFGWSVD